MARAPIWLSELEQKLLETNAALAGNPFPLDHLYNVIAQLSPGPFTETEAINVAPLLARVLTIEQLRFLVDEARQVFRQSAEDIASATLGYIAQQAAGLDTNKTPAMHISAPPHWSHRHSLAPQGALLLALMWAVLPPGDLPESN